MERWIRFVTHLAIPVLFVFSLPWFFPFENTIQLAQTFAITYLVIAGLNLLAGLTNHYSVGHIGFYAIGAYGAAFFHESLGFPLPGAVLMAAALAGGIGALLSVLTIRLKGWQFVLVTFGFGELITLLSSKWAGLSGAGMAVTTTAPDLFGLPLNTAQYFWVIGFFAVAFSYFLGNLFKGRFGRTFVAVGNDEKAAAAMGIHNPSWKVSALAISAFLAGAGGGFFAFQKGMFGGPSFQLEQSLLFLLGVLIGGAGSKWGAVLGTTAVVILQQCLPSLPGTLLFIYGGAIFLCLGLFPNGVVGMLSRLPIAKRLRANKGRIVFYPSEPDVEFLQTQQGGSCVCEDRQIQMNDLKVFKDLSVIENVMIGFHRNFRHGFWANLMDLQRVDKEEQGYLIRAYEILRLVGLEKKAFVKASTLTLKEKELLGIARGIAYNPSAVKGLDPMIQKKVKGYAN